MRMTFLKVGVRSPTSWNKIKKKDEKKGNAERKRRQG
jgi:hypothetical protein